MAADHPLESLPTAPATIAKLIIAGWTGRDPAAVSKHIEELKVIGVKPPSTVPVFYEVSPLLLTSSSVIHTVGPETSGEVEFVLLNTAKGLAVTVGSDHTDRWLEAVSVHHSKQACPKPVAANAWLFEPLAEHWDELILRSFSTRNGTRRLYQEGPVTGMLEPADLLARYRATGGDFAVGTAMSCGTLALRDGLEYGNRFEIELEDPISKRFLRHCYEVKEISISS